MAPPVSFSVACELEARQDSSRKNQEAFFRPPPVSSSRSSSREISMRMPKLACDFDQSFGTRVGERTKACAEAGGEDHGFHRKTRGASKPEVRAWALETRG